MSKLNKDILKCVAPWLVIGGIICLAWCFRDKDGAADSVMDVLFSGASSMEDFEVACDTAVIPRGQDVLWSRFPCNTDYQDVYSRRIVELLLQGRMDADEVKFDIDVLDQLVGKRRTHLFRYLSAHPGWWLHKDRGGLKAVRRYRFQDVWQSSAHRAGGDFEGWIGPWACRREFSVRLVIGFDGARFSHVDYGDGENRIEVVKAGESKLISAIASGGEYRSDIEIRGENVGVNLLEIQPFADRRLTKAFLELLRKEFSAVSAAQGWDDLKRLLPEGAIMNSPLSLTLYGDSLGKYIAFARVNPGEAGQIYFRARGLRTGNELWQTRLKGLKKDTNEYVGWSANTNEKFFASSSLTIHDGRGSDIRSPVKMEVWFSPDAGGDDRKLFEKVFMLTSWER